MEVEFSPKAGLFRRLKNASEWYTAKKVVDAYIVQKQVKEISCTLISLSSSLSTVTKTHILIDENIFSNFWSKQKWIYFPFEPLYSPTGHQLACASEDWEIFQTFFFFTPDTFFWFALTLKDSREDTFTMWSWITE